MIQDVTYNSKTGEWDDPISSTSCCIGLRKSERQLRREDQDRLWAEMTDDQKANWMRNEKEFEQRKKDNYHY